MLREHKGLFVVDNLEKNENRPLKGIFFRFFDTFYLKIHLFFLKKKIKKIPQFSEKNHNFILRSTPTYIIF